MPGFEKPLRGLLVLLLPLVGGLVAFVGLIRAFQWTDPVPEGVQLQAVPWPEPGPFNRALVVVLDGVHPRSAFDERACPFLASHLDRARYGTAMVPYVAFTTTCIRTLLAGVGFDLLAAMKNFRADKFGEDNLFARVREAGGRTAVVTDDILWDSLFGDHIDENSFLEVPPDSPAEAGDLLVADRLPEVWRDPNFQLVVAHFAAIDILGHRFGTEDPVYLRHLHYVDGVIGELAEGLREGELLVVLSDHGADLAGGHSGGELAGREAFYFLYSTDGRLVPGDGGTVSQKDISSTLAAALGVAIPNVSQGQVRTSWFAIDPAARAAMVQNNLAQLRAGPARRVDNRALLDDPDLLMERAAELGASRLRLQSWGYVLFTCVAALAAILWIRRMLWGHGSSARNLPATFLPVALALAASLALVWAAIGLLAEDLSDSVSPWLVRGAFVALFAVVVPLCRKTGFSTRLRRGLPEPGVAFLLPCLLFLGLAPLTMRVGFYQLVVVGLGLAAFGSTLVPTSDPQRQQTADLRLGGLVLVAFVGLRLLLERQSIDVRLAGGDIATWLLSLVLAVSALRTPGPRAGAAPRLGIDRLGLFFCLFAFGANLAAPGNTGLLVALSAGCAVLLGGAWWSGTPQGVGALAALLGLYRYLSTDAEVILLCLVLIGVRFLLRGLRLQRFNQMCLAAPVALALFIYTLYALDEPITFERINVLIGDLVGVGGRDVTGTILLASAKYILPMFLLVGLVFREARSIAAPVVSLVAWALVFRLIGGIVVVSHHPRNFGEVTRIIGESIYAIVLLIVLITGTAVLLISPAFRRDQGRARGRDAAHA